MRMRWRSSAVQGLGVLLGISTAFAIDAAWQDRGERDREVAYLQALSAELETNGRRFRAYQQRAEAAIAKNEVALRTVVFADNRVTPEVLSEVIADFGALFLTLPERAALSDILASGGVAYIEDPEVRRLISRYADALDQQVAAQENVVELWRGRLVSYFEAHASLYDMLGADAWSGGQTLALGLGSFEADRDAFIGNREFANLVVHHSILAGAVRAETGQLLSVMDELASALGGAPQDQL